MSTTPTSTIARVFDDVARFYDTPLLQQLAYQPLQDLALETLRRYAPSTIVDIGCGTGILTDRLHRELAPRKTYGCDPSTGMLAKAAARGSAVEWIEGTAEAVPLPDASVDAVTTTTAFHFFDQPAALREFSRILKPGGVVAIGAATAHTRVTARAFASMASLVGTGFVPSATELRRMADAAGLAVVEQVRPVRLRSRQIDPMMLTVAVKPSGLD